MALVDVWEVFVVEPPFALNVTVTDWFFAGVPEGSV
jgi:hypothetical protein